ncbi:MAG: nucleotidyltransferase domain-containing protein [Chloroflexi bacterium]|nr:nucleotidyltransferase domain-containing protein [Chloroflexota bacterium]
MISAHTTALICEIVRAHYPTVQAIYLFGTYGTADEWPDSDADIALLLPHAEAKTTGNLMLSPCCAALEKALGRAVDLLNARHVSTVFQKEIVANGRLLYSGDTTIVDEFEMLTLSFYQKFNEERAEIVEAGLSSGRFYHV